MLPTRLVGCAVCGTAVVPAVVPAAVGAAGCLVFKVLVRRDPIKYILHAHYLTRILSLGTLCTNLGFDNVKITYNYCLLLT